MIGSESYLKDIKPLDQIIGKFAQEGWVAELSSNFDSHMQTYLPRDAKLTFNHEGEE